MPNFSKPEIVLVSYQFSDLTSSKVCPAVVVNAAHSSQDLFVVALTSKTSNLLAGEFVLADWKTAGLNVETALKRGIFTIKQTLVKKRVGKLSDADAEQLEKSLRTWLDCRNFVEGFEVMKEGNSCKVIWIGRVSQNYLR